MTEPHEIRNRIVVGVDLSETGDYALRYAVQLIRQLARGELHVASVIPADPHKGRLGAIAEELLRTAQVPVVVAQPKNYDGLDKSDRLEPARPGQDMRTHALSVQVHLEFLPRTPHISGLI